MADDIFSQTHKLWLLSLMAEGGSFRSAALVAGISVSAISQNIASLEAFLGKTLLIRQKGRVDLTQNGKELLVELQPILFGLKALVPQRNLGSEDHGGVKLRLGAYESIAIHFLPVLLPRLRMRSPGIKLEVRTARSHSLLSMVDRGELDLALVVEHGMRHRIEAQAFAHDDLGVFASPRHPVIQEGWDAVRSHGLGTLAPPNDGYPRYFQKFMKSLGKKANIMFRTDSFETLRNLARQGTLIAVLPVRVAMRFPGELIPVLPGNHQLDPGSHRFCLIMRKNIDREVKKLIVEELSSILPDSPLRLSYS